MTVVDEPEIEEDEEVEANERAARTKEPATEVEDYGKVIALWNEIKPALRDLLFMAVGSLEMLLLIFLGTWLTGINLVHIVYIAGLFTAMAASYSVDLYLR